MNKDLERLLELHIADKRYYPDFLHSLTIDEKKEYEELKSKLNEKLEKAELYDRICDSSATEYMVKLEQQIKQLKEELERVSRFRTEYGLHEMEIEIQSLKEENRRLKDG